MTNETTRPHGLAAAREAARWWRHSAVLVLVLVWELWMLGSAVWAAVQPAAAYTFTPDQLEEIASDAQITYDDAGRRGVTEFATEGQDILQTPMMSLPAGHYRITLEYAYDPTMVAGGNLHRSNVRFSASEGLSVTGEFAFLYQKANRSTVVLNVAAASDTVRLVFHDDGGTFTVGTVEIRQDMGYAAMAAVGYLALFLLLNAALCLLLPTSPICLPPPHAYGRLGAGRAYGAGLCAAVY